MYVCLCVYVYVYGHVGKKMNEHTNVPLGLKIHKKKHTHTYIYTHTHIPCATTAEAGAVCFATNFIAFSSALLLHLPPAPTHINTHTNTHMHDTHTQLRENKLYKSLSLHAFK